MSEHLEKNATQAIEHLLDVPLRIAVEVGRTRLSIGELLALSPGAVVELDKAAGEPLDVLVNGRAVARGEAVLINEKFGVRITEVLPRAERLQRLRGDE
ncbi:MAG: flagellar motor switch protein FliN [Pseudomonadota bacterium]